jgi:hypothetical protein
LLTSLLPRALTLRIKLRIIISYYSTEDLPRVIV